MENILIYFAVKYNGDWKSIFNAIQRKEKVELSTANEIAERKKREYNIITIIDEDYPDFFKHIYMPPFVLFYKEHKPTEESVKYLPKCQGAYIFD